MPARTERFSVTACRRGRGPTDQPPTAQEIEAHRSLGRPLSPAESVRRRKDPTRSVILADIADAQGDVDACMARYSAEQLTCGIIARSAARRLLEAGRREKAFDIVTRARVAEAALCFRILRPDLDAVHEECLARLGRHDDLKSHLWGRFEERLCADSLRKHLWLLPDFEEVEAEDQALAHAEACPDLTAAIGFLVNWPAPERAARIILQRAEALDGNACSTLVPAADALEAMHPLAAVLLRRAMIEDTLEGGKSSRHRHVARHLAECRAEDGAIGTYGTFPTQDAFLSSLQKAHGRRHGFWQLVEA